MTCKMGGIAQWKGDGLQIRDPLVRLRVPPPRMFCDYPLHRAFGAGLGMLLISRRTFDADIDYRI